MQSPTTPGSPSGSQSPFRIAAVLGTLVVALGAFGAHGLEDTFETFGTAAIWQTGVFYHAIHAVALLALAASGRAGRLVTGLWLAGVIIFSGSLYLMAVTNMRWLGMITPIGGLALIGGWVALIFSKR